ncbi:MAG: PilZ domain-containing protein [Sphingomonas taxi]
MPLRKRREAVAGRAYQRFPTAFDAKIEQFGVHLDTQVANISVRGAKIRMPEGSRPLYVGMPARLLAEGLDVEGIVIRHVGDSYGLRFGTDIVPLQVIRNNLPVLRHLCRRTGAFASA